MKTRNRIGSLIAAAAAIALASPSYAQQYPSRPVTMIVPYAPGGATDVLARVVGQKLSEALGQPFIIENRPGASSMIGTEAVVRAPADGYTILVAGSSLATNALIYKEKVPYKISDLAPIGLIAETPMTLEVNPGVPAKTLKEFIDYAKANPSKLNYATFGRGTIPHLTCELVSQATGIKMVDVSYKGASPAMNDVVSGVIQVFCDVATTTLPLHEAGKSRVLATMTKQRLPFAPAIPTFAELGYPSVLASTTFGLLAPAGTPAVVIERINIELAKVLKLPDVIDRIQKLDSVPLTGGPSDFAALIASERQKWGPVVDAISQ